MVDVVGWRLDDVVQLIRGPNGSFVRLQIQPGNAPPGTQEHVLTLPRSKITLEAQAAKKEVRKIQRGDKELKIGVITVPSFYQDYNARAAGDEEYRSTTRDVRKLIEELKTEGGVDGMVLDLRENGGGHLSEAIGLVNLFVPKGPVVQLRETGGRVEVLESDEKGVAYDGPLTILVDRFSASASEIFAAAMQDYGRGLVIGQETYGKGSVQNLYPLDRYALGQDPGYGQLTVTIGMYYRVTGDSTQNRGVQPDLALPSAISAEEVGESSRDGSLPWNRIRPARLPPRRRLCHLVAGAAARARRTHRDRPELPVRGGRNCRARKDAQREVRLAEPGGAQGRARKPYQGAARARERAARGLGPGTG